MPFSTPMSRARFARPSLDERRSRPSMRSGAAFPCFCSTSTMRETPANLWVNEWKKVEMAGAEKSRGREETDASNAPVAPKRFLGRRRERSWASHRVYREARVLAAPRRCAQFWARNALLRSRRRRRGRPRLRRVRRGKRQYFAAFWPRKTLAWIESGDADSGWERGVLDEGAEEAESARLLRDALRSDSSQLPGHLVEHAVIAASLSAANRRRSMRPPPISLRRSLPRKSNVSHVRGSRHESAGRASDQRRPSQCIRRNARPQLMTRRKRAKRNAARYSNEVAHQTGHRAAEDCG